MANFTDMSPQDLFHEDRRMTNAEVYDFGHCTDPLLDTLTGRSGYFETDEPVSIARALVNQGLFKRTYLAQQLKTIEGEI